MATLPFDLLASMDLRAAYLGVPQETGPGNWFGMDGTTYMLLPADGSLTAAEIDAGLDAIVASHMPEQQAAFGSLVLEVLPVTKMLGLDASGMFLGGRGSITGVLWLLGSLVLGIACLNYASLGAARVAGRAHEVGVRKSIGAGAKDILLQHLLEAGLLTAGALALAVLFVRALSPVAETAFGIDLSFALSGEPRFLAFVVALAFAVTLLAGAFPAFVLSRVRPIFALRGYQLRVGRKLLLSVLVGLQVAAASFLSIAVAVIYLQNLDIRRTGLAIATDPLLVIENPRELTGLSFETLREQLLRLPQLSAVTATETPILDYGTLPLAGSADESAPQRLAAAYRVSYDFAAVFELEVLAGRFFERDRPDSTREDPRNSPDIVIDRALAEFFGFATPIDAVGKVVYVPKDFLMSFGLGNTARPLQVIGVVETKPIAIGGGAHPGAAYRLGAEFPYTIARIPRDNVAGALAQIDELWQRLVPGVALSRRFVDEIFENEYAQHGRIASAMRALCGFAVLIAVIGLFAMAQVVVARRAQEIAVRKVLGAKTPLMIVMLLRGFALLVLAASLAAWPVTLIAMRGYLDRFARPIELNITLFCSCLLGMLLIASLTVGAPILRAARTRPSAALRHE
jgi:putative ABC transport system permease protein